MRRNNAAKKLTGVCLAILPLALILLTAGCRVGSPKLESPVAAGAPSSSMSFNLSLGEPASSLFRVIFHYEGVDSETVELKMPAWTPGYYRILNFAKNVTGFQATENNSRPLFWEKINENTWRVKAEGATSIQVTYEVVALGKSIAESRLTEEKAYISPASVFMYVSGKLGHPVTLTIISAPNFQKITTGLESVKGEKYNFIAENFDVLYDCPIFIGNQQVLTFEVDGIPYELAIEKPGEFDQEEVITTLRKMIKAATDIIGEIPYKRYTFIMMADGGGGLEHRNSMAVFTRIPQSNNRPEFQRWLSFIAHEFFHLYNVKAIRPVALGPFDYDRENRTNMLWFSEGGTVYYEYIILNRAGFMIRQEFLDTFSRIITKYENSGGRKIESPAQASYNTWTQPFFGSEKTISYYDAGAILAMLLDLKIRHETEGRQSLDDVMRALYKRFFKELKRGFTDEEFRQVCEEIAGPDLSEFFEYVYTTKEIDYNKYLGYAGLELEKSGQEGKPSLYKIKPGKDRRPEEIRLLENWLK